MILKIVAALVLVLFIWDIGVVYSSINKAQELKEFNENITYTFNNEIYNNSLDVLLIGDSIAAGMGASGFNNSLAANIGRYLEEENKANIILENRAKTGNKISDVIESNESKSKYDYIIIIASSNDVFRFTNKNSFKKDLKRLLDKYSNMSEKVIIVGPGKVYGTSPIPFYVKPIYYHKGIQIGKIVKDTTDKYDNVVHVNPHDNLNLRDYGDIEAIDNFHPNDKGHIYWFDMTKIGIEKLN